MALSLNQKKIIKRAIAAYGAQQEPGNTYWLVDLLLLTKAQQKTALTAALTQVRSDLVTAQNALPTQQAAVNAQFTADGASLTTDIADLDNAVTQL